jgi:hypothetical protein
VRMAMARDSSNVPWATLTSREGAPTPALSTLPCPSFAAISALVQVIRRDPHLYRV